MKNEGGFQLANACRAPGSRMDMSSNFHEHYWQPDLQPPTDRATGFVLAALAAAIVVLFKDRIVVVGAAGVLALMLIATSLIKPRLLHPFNLLWFQLGRVLHRTVNPVVLRLLFAVGIVPAGLIMQVVRDPLRKKSLPKTSSYWVESEAGQSMKNQF